MADEEEQCRQSILSLYKIFEFDALDAANYGMYVNEEGSKGLAALVHKPNKRTKRCS